MPKVYADVPIADIFSPSGVFHSFGDVVNVIVRNAFVLAALICFFLLVFGGLTVIMGAGSGESKKMESGKQAITGAVLGLIVVFASVWIVIILGRITGIQFLNNIIR